MAPATVSTLTCYAHSLHSRSGVSGVCTLCSADHHAPFVRVCVSRSPSSCVKLCTESCCPSCLTQLCTLCSSLGSPSGPHWSECLTDSRPPSFPPPLPFHSHFSMCPSHTEHQCITAAHTPVTLLFSHPSPHPRPFLLCPYGTPPPLGTRHVH
jgi:hypothetical protein